MNTWITYLDSPTGTLRRECWPNERMARERYEALTKTGFARNVHIVRGEPNASTYDHAR